MSLNREVITPDFMYVMLLAGLSAPKSLEDRNLLKLRSLDSSFPFFLSDNSIGENEFECSKCYDRKDKRALRTSRCCNR